MKVIRYTLLILLSLLLLNLITYFLIGKKSLRERNISEMMKTEFENPYDLKLEFQLVSDLQLDSTFKFQNKKYPVFQTFIDKNGKRDFETNSSEVIKQEKFTLDLSAVNKILNTDLDSINKISPENTYTLLNEYFKQIVDSVSDSIEALPFRGKIGGNCEYYEFSKEVHCIVFGNRVISFDEEIIDLYPWYVEQELFVIAVGSDVWLFREEKLIWLFYKWVQIDWIDGNGLGGDDPSSKR
ncbi:hypothetical protein A8B79_09430 [Balneola sp. EhC07]|uniref:hypothetical protein n=1 Tax=Balneola sp. EhC07 TaxID=1849360 RepID=UPI0007F3CE87|nr:hypothetical protein [Balneola sp. EhC07]OAN60732.1 hypothetical protein A8B79_09430 [Balneola sp. EhC07]